jgi:hypothetical protein
MGADHAYLDRRTSRQFFSRWRIYRMGFSISGEHVVASEFVISLLIFWA